MAIQIQGFSGVVAEVAGTGFRALKVQQMPIEYGSLGSYRKSLLSGTMAAGLAANSTVWSWRWSDATRLGVLRRVSLSGLAGSATAFTAGFGKVDLMAARGFSSSDSGGTGGTLTGNNGKMRTAMGTSLLGDIRIASTAALTPGTRTLDTDPIGQFSFTVGTVVSVQYAGQITLLGEDVGPEHPYVAAQNEGVTMRATMPATGTWQFCVTCTWAEVTSY